VVDGVDGSTDGCPKAALPSSEAASAFLAGAEGSTTKLVGSTVLRAALIAPGLWIAGVRDPKKIVLGALTSSALISTFILIYMNATKPKPPKRHRPRP